MDRCNNSGESRQRRGRVSRKKISRKKISRQKIKVREKVGKPGNTLFSQCLAALEPCGCMRDQKLHTAVGRFACRSDNAENTPAPSHFSQLRCWKSARRCGAKCANHVRNTFRSQNAQNTLGGEHYFGSWEMLKKCTPQSRKAHLNSECQRKLHVRKTFGGCDGLGPLLDVQMSKKWTLPLALTL